MPWPSSGYGSDWKHPWDEQKGVRVPEEAAQWREHTLSLAGEAFALTTVVAALEQRYFAGDGVLFAEEREGLVQAMAAWEETMCRHPPIENCPGGLETRSRPVSHGAPSLGPRCPA
jgi:hypothetical protein